MHYFPGILFTLSFGTIAFRMKFLHALIPYQLTITLIINVTTSKLDYKLKDDCGKKHLHHQKASIFHFCTH